MLSSSIYTLAYVYEIMRRSSNDENSTKEKLKKKMRKTTTLANFIVPLNRSIVMDKFRVLCSKYHKLFIIIYYFASLFHYITTDSKFMFRLWFFPRWKKNNISLNRSFSFCLHCAMIRIYIVIEFLSIYRVTKIV